MGSHSLLQSIFLTRGLNPGLLHCRQTRYQLSVGIVWASVTTQAVCQGVWGQAGCSAFLMDEAQVNGQRPRKQGSAEI